MKPTWKIFSTYLLVLFFILICNSAFGQKICKEDVCVVEFNAGWNESNEVNWVHDLTEVKTISYVDIAKQADMAKKHKIAVIPTIIIFKDNEEVARFQADLSFKMVATKDEVQEEIDNILMSDF